MCRWVEEHPHRGRGRGDGIGSFQRGHLEKGKHLKCKFSPHNEVIQRPLLGQVTGWIVCLTHYSTFSTVINLSHKCKTAQNINN